MGDGAVGEVVPDVLVDYVEVLIAHVGELVDGEKKRVVGESEILHERDQLVVVDGVGEGHCGYMGGITTSVMVSAVLFSTQERRRRESEF